MWEAVSEALQQPEMLVAEYERQLALAALAESVEAERKQIQVAMGKVSAQEDRITDAYKNEAMELERYKAEMDELRRRRQELGRTDANLGARAKQYEESRKALEQLDRFCRRVADGLEALTFEERQQLLRLVVERVNVEDGVVHIETIIPVDGGADGQRHGQLRTRRQDER